MPLLCRSSSLFDNDSSKIGSICGIHLLFSPTLSCSTWKLEWMEKEFIVKVERTKISRLRWDSYKNVYFQIINRYRQWLPLNFYGNWCTLLWFSEISQFPITYLIKHRIIVISSELKRITNFSLDLWPLIIGYSFAISNIVELHLIYMKVLHVRTFL